MKGTSMMKRFSTLVLAVVSIVAMPQNRSLGEDSFTNSLGMNMIRIEPGSFTMGSEDGDWDERPAREVTISQPFFMSTTEVTNAQHEKFDPQHKQFRGKLGFSKADDEAVVFVSWNDAVAFCRWLSDKESKPYRLPTEAEWEYACRAGTTTAYHTGKSLPQPFYKNVGMSWFPGRKTGTDIVPLHVGKTPANPWGLYDMHGNVEEWCLDWYGPYVDDPQTDPTGRADGDFRVTRGGSHSTTLEFLRSANRGGTLPDDRSWLIGFRVVQADMPSTEPLPASPAPLNARDVEQKVPGDLAEGPHPATPYFEGPRQYVHQPPAEDCPVFNRHNHCPALVNCPNGDLLAIWYTCRTEPGRELGIVASRLPYGEDQWQVASDFWDAPDRNDHASALWVDEKGTLYHFNGLSAAATWGSLATIMRTSTDNGATWSKARLIMPEHGLHHMPIESVLRTREGAILVPCDAVPGGAGGSVVLISRDDGQTWTDPAEGQPIPDFSAGSTGASIAGIHAGFVQLADGRLMAFGRGNNIDGRMPTSVSDDLGETWTYSASPFPPIGGGQRLVILRLQEGAILFCSFGREVRFQDAAGNEQVGSGLFAALSTDDGESWEIKRLITDDAPPRTIDGGGNTGRFTMSATSAEPRGYLSICQTPDRVIHLISSKQHYAFNLAWLNTPPPAPPEPVELEVKAELQTTYRPKGLPSKAGWRYNGTGAVEAEAVEVLPDEGIRVTTGANQRVRSVGDTKQTFVAKAGAAHTAEITMRVPRSTSDSRGIDFETYVPGVGRSFITVTKSSVFWHGAGFDQIAERLDNASAAHIYRLAISANGLVQIFRDGKRLALRSTAGEPDRMARAQGAYIQWGEGAGASEADAVITHVAYDTTGAYRPEP
jgi:formylglycine-generating enzyme required for sulfatase activity